MALNDGHWKTEKYRQRMESGEWKKILLTNSDKIIFSGRRRELEAESIGYGLVEVYKAPLDE